MAKKTSPSTNRPSKTTAKKRPVTTQKSPATKQHSAVTSPRRLKQPHYKFWQVHKRIKHPVRLPSSWWLAKQTARTLWNQKALLFGIVLIYGILNFILVRGLSGGTNVSALKASLQSAFGGDAWASSLTIFGVLLGSSGSSSTASGSGYQLVLLLIVSLAVIWALREILAGMPIRIRDAYYRGMYPLIPFVLVLAVIFLQLIPMAVGSSVYSLVISNGIAVYPIEKLLWALLLVVLVLISLYMVSSSIFALYIVTLPDMTPLKALRSARQLVRYRRWTVLRKLLVLPVLLLIVAAAVMLPVILLIAPAAQWVFYLLTMIAILVAHTYLYSLYRELLNE